MAKLRHIAFISPDPQLLSEFYQKHFALEEVKIFPSGSRMVIDGLFNLAFLKRREQVSAVIGTHRSDGAELERQPGIHHYGFMVDDLPSAVAKLPAWLDRATSPQASDGVGGVKGRGQRKCASSIPGATTSICRHAVFSAEKRKSFRAFAWW